MSLDQRWQTLSVKEAAEIIGVHPQLIYLAINRGQLKAKRINGRQAGIPGKAIRIDIESLRAWFDSLDDVADPA